MILNSAVRSQVIGMLGAAVFLALGGGTLAAQDGTDSVPVDSVLSVSEVVSRVLEADPGIINSGRTVESARARYGLTRSGTRPDLSLEVTPYSWDQRRVPGTMSGEMVRTRSVGAGLALNQALPTSGVVSAGVSNRLNFVDASESEITQTPEVSFSLSQPLGVNGRLISDDAFRAGLRSAEIGVEQAVLGNALTVNGAIDYAMNLLVQVGSLRRSVALIEETIDILRRQLESAEIDRQQGLISDNALLALQVTLNGRREALFDMELMLLQAEQELARTLGLPSLEGISVVERPESLDVPAIDDLSAAVRGNPNIAVQELAVEQTIRSATINDLEDRPRVSLSARLAPLYPPNRDEADSLSSSAGDLFAEGSDLEATVAVGVAVPLLTGRERAYRSRIDEIARMQAETDLTDTERSVANRLQTLRASRDFLQRRVDLLLVDVEYEEQRVENERFLLQAGATTELRVDEVELDLRSRRNELLQVQGELFLNAIQILALLGEDLAEVLVEG
jgi:outer membrane protein TolC